MRRERREIELLLEDSPSLAGDVARMIARQGPRAAKDAVAGLSGYGETGRSLPSPSYAVEQVLGEWFPEAPKLAP